MISNHFQHTMYRALLIARKFSRGALLAASLPFILAAGESSAQATLTGAVKVAAGRWHTCALTGSGAVKCWGNNYGKLGDNTNIDRFTPVNAIGLTSGVTSISTGAGQSCAITSAGGVKCTGYLAVSLTAASFVPVDIPGLTTGVATIGSGDDHICVVTTGGGAKCWGFNGDFLTGATGQLGNNSGVNSLTPVDVVGLTSGVSAITLGRYHTCALTTAGGVKCWGGGTFIAADVPGFTSGIKAVDAGAVHTCALRTNGTIACWGV